jgi:hypothetical protein
MLFAVVVALMLARATPVTIYVGPYVKDGFADADKSVMDSIADVRRELRKNRALRVVERESDATLELFVLVRGTEDGSSVTSTHIPGQTIGIPGVKPSTVTIGSTTFTNPGTPDTHYTMPSITVSGPNQVRYLVTVLRVGEHTRAFVAEGTHMWTTLARNIGRDLESWLDANRERIAKE